MGGVTTVFEMPNTNPPTGTVDALNMKLESAKKAYVDFGIYGLLGEDNLYVFRDILGLSEDEYLTYAAEGVI